jgi:hypothetical protein
MSVTDYVAEIQRRILDTSYVVSHSLGYEERPPLGAIVIGSVTFADGSHLYIKEFATQIGHGQAEVRVPLCHIVSRSYLQI